MELGSTCRAQFGHADGESSAFESVQNLVEAARWVAPGVRDLLDGCVDGRSIEADLVAQELVRGLRLDVPLTQFFGREVAQVRGDDHLRARPDRSGEDVAVVWVGKLDGV